MSRGFDGFEIDDFRGSDSGSEREVGRNSSSSWDKWKELQNIYREEERTTWRNSPTTATGAAWKTMSKTSCAKDSRR